MPARGWGTNLPTFRLRVVACMVGVKKRVGGGPGEVKKGEQLGREGKGQRRSFFIFPFALFSSSPSHFFAHHTGCHRLWGRCGAFNSLSLPYWEFERSFGTWRMTANNWRVRHHRKGRNGERSCHLSYFLYLPAISHVEIYKWDVGLGTRLLTLQTRYKLPYLLYDVSKTFLSF